MAVVNLALLEQSLDLIEEDLAGRLHAQRCVDIIAVSAKHTGCIHRRVVEHLLEVAAIRVQNVLLLRLVLALGGVEHEALAALAERHCLDTRHATDDHRIEQLRLELLVARQVVEASRLRLGRLIRRLLRRKTDAHDQLLTVKVRVDCIDVIIEAAAEDEENVIHGDVLVKHPLPVELEAEEPLAPGLM